MVLGKRWYFAKATKPTSTSSPQLVLTNAILQAMPTCTAYHLPHQCKDLPRADSRSAWYASHPHGTLRPCACYCPADKVSTQRGPTSHDYSYLTASPFSYLEPLQPAHQRMFTSPSPSALTNNNLQPLHAPAHHLSSPCSASLLLSCASNLQRREDPSKLGL